MIESIYFAGLESITSDLKKLAKMDLGADATTRILAGRIAHSLDTLDTSETVELNSEVVEKKYFAFSKAGNLSRPVRLDLPPGKTQTARSRILVGRCL